MSKPFFATLLTLVVVALVLPMPIAAQEPAAGGETWSPLRTPWGDPDLQGIWTNTTTTPLERPDDLAGKAVLTDEEWALRNPVTGLSDDRRDPDSIGFYNDFWLEQGQLSRQTSLVVDPPNGKQPPVTPAEQARQNSRTDSYIGARFDSWRDFNVYDQCITRGLPGSMTPGFYNHNYQILQTPGQVVIFLEMIHDARIIPLDGRAHPGSGVKQWLGDSRGHWDGNTLVVETTNFNNKIHMRKGTVSGGTEYARVVERFTRIDADTIDYEVTVVDPTVWTGPWTASMPMTATEGPLFEYACHEGNYSVPNALSGARASELAEAQAAASGSR